MNKSKSVKEILDEFMNSDTYKEQKKLIEERNKTVKTGDNVVHLEHLGGFTDDDLKELNEQLAKINLEFSSFNKSGIMYNSLDEYLLTSFFVINQPLLKEIYKSLSTSALWDTLKWSILFGFGKLKGKKIFKNSGGKIEEKKIKFGLQVNLDENTGFNFELEGDVDRETIENSLDKVLTFLKDQTPNKNYKIPDYAYYSKEKEKWMKLDVMDEISKKIKKGK